MQTETGNQVDEGPPARLLTPEFPHRTGFDPCSTRTGRTPGQPCSSHGLGERLRRHGVSKAARIAAFHDLVQQVPSTVLADLIDYNPAVVAKRAQALAAPWHTYAALRATTPRRDSR